MKNVFVLFFLLWSQATVAQTIIIGDSTNKHVEKINHDYFNSIVSFDFDCDGLADVSFDCSSLGFPSRITINKAPQVEILLSDYQIATFSGKQTVHTSDSNFLWTTGYDFLSGNGGGGAFGQQLNQKYIVFRKPNLIDTTYFFMEISNGISNVYVHNVISNCQSSLLIPLEVHDQVPDKFVAIYPNPFEETIYIDQPKPKDFDLSVYDFQGKLIRQFLKINQKSIDLSDLRHGTYLLRMVVDKKQKTNIFIKK